MQQTFEPYLQENKLIQYHHPFSKQNNKAIHNAINQTTPKNIDYSCSNSLKNGFQLPVVYNQKG